MYDEKLKEYASQFDTSTMSETEIIVTVMRDIREKTYYDNSFDRSGIGNNYRSVLDDNNNHGVCRHMADKFTTIMNMIDPRYEAYNLLHSSPIFCPGAVFKCVRPGQHCLFRPGTGAGG